MERKPFFDDRAPKNTKHFEQKILFDDILTDDEDSPDEPCEQNYEGQTNFCSYQEFYDEEYHSIYNIFITSLERKHQRILVKPEKEMILSFLRKLEEFQIDFHEYHNEILGVIDRAIDLSQKREKRGVFFLKEVCTHDPRVILGIPPRKHPLETLFEDRGRQIEFKKYLREYLSIRSEDAWLLLKGFGLSMLTGTRSIVPILLGPPAGGKSFIPQVLAKALREVGLKVETLLVNAGVDRGVNDECEMKLLGIDSHWGNSSPGEIFKLSKETDFLIVVLDEIDKKEDRRFFLELFDTSIPLKDRCVGTVAPRMNLRQKVFFIGTANKLSWENDHAFSSRVEVLTFKPYTPKEKTEIVQNLLKKDLSDMPEEAKQMIIETILQRVKSEGLDIRKALGLGRVLASLVMNSPLSEAEKEVKALLRRSYSKETGSERHIGFLAQI